MKNKTWNELSVELVVDNMKSAEFHKLLKDRRANELPSPSISMELPSDYYHKNPEYPGLFWIKNKNKEH